jgi:hypothetical protein
MKIHLHQKLKPLQVYWRLVNGQQYHFENGRAYYKLNTDGKLVKVENKRMIIDTTNFPYEVQDDFSTIESSYPVNSTTYSV